VRAEHRSLTGALRPVRGLLSLDFARADDDAAIDEALRAGCDLFHYAGYVDVIDGRGMPVQVMGASGFDEFRAQGVFSGLEARPGRAPWARADGLARAG
jgi:hypothetical protein